MDCRAVQGLEDKTPLSTKTHAARMCYCGVEILNRVAELDPAMLQKHISAMPLSQVRPRTSRTPVVQHCSVSGSGGSQNGNSAVIGKAAENAAA